MEPIIPEPVNEPNPNYTPDAWNYPARCADIDLAMSVTREKVEEWDRERDLDGWWHDRTYLIALYNEVVTLRRDVCQIALVTFEERGTLPDDDDHYPLSDSAWETFKRVWPQEAS
jgi:hypothetical protein